MKDEKLASAVSGQPLSSKIDSVEPWNEKALFREARNGMTNWQWLLFHLIVFLGAAISGYDVSNVATIQVSIYKAYGHIDLLPWVVTAFSLGNAATNPILNQIMQLVDLKWFVLSCWLLFLAASAVVGASPTIDGVIVGRTILGISGGGIYLALLTYINILAKPTEHPRVNGLLGMGFAVGLILGPIIGGAFAENEHATWRWAFYLCLPYSAVVMVLTYLVCPRVRVRPQADIVKGLLNIDWVGAALHMATLVLFDAACIFSGSSLPWNSGVIALWVLSGVVAALYAVQQRCSLFTTPQDRILPIAVMSTRTGLLVVICTAMACTGYGVVLYYLPLLYAFVRGDDAIETAVHMLPYICVYIAGVIGSGILLPKVRRYAPIYLASGLLIVAGSGAMQSINKDTSLSQSMGISAILGLGVGSTVQLGASVMNFGLSAEIRMASGITMSIALYSGLTIALAIAGCISQNIGYDFLSEALRDLPLSSEQIRGALAGVASPEWKTALSSELVASAIEAVTLAIIRMFYISLAAGAVMVVCAVCMKWEALDFTVAKAEQPREV